MAPLIALPARRVKTSEANNPVIGAYQPYLAALIRSGAVPFLVPLGLEPTALRSLYTLAQGIMLMGGEDVDPALYGEIRHSSVANICPERDGAEIQLVHWAVEDKKPLLAICRGVQVLNVALGGSLHQDINSDQEQVLPHRGKHYEINHTIALEPGSQLAQILCATQVEANSAHHQSIKKLAKGLQITARSSDGIVEGVEGDNNSFLLGVQCHPEMMQADTNSPWPKIFEAFVAAAAAYKNA